MATAFIRDDSGEFEIRNALSRAYYALFHACHAWLAVRNVPESKRNDRVAVFGQVRSGRGKESGGRLDEFWLWRKRADYDKPEFLEAVVFQGDWSKVRLSARAQLSLMEREFESYLSEVEC
jgi:uncharacterized protein (UPF0332 family)